MQITAREKCLQLRSKAVTTFVSDHGILKQFQEFPNFKLFPETSSTSMFSQSTCTWRSDIDRLRRAIENSNFHSYLWTASVRLSDWFNSNLHLSKICVVVGSTYYPSEQRYFGLFIYVLYPIHNSRHCLILWPFKVSGLPCCRRLIRAEAPRPSERKTKNKRGRPEALKGQLLGGGS